MIEHRSLRATGDSGVIHSLNTTKPLQHGRKPHMGDMPAREPHTECGWAQFLTVRSQWAGTQSGRDFSPAFPQAADLIKNVDFSHAS